MLVFGLIGAAFVIAALSLLVFRLAGLALPFWVSLASFFAALHRGIDPLLAMGAAVLLGALTLIVGQAAFARARSLASRAAVAAVFVLPASIAGYHVAADIVALTTVSQVARIIAGIGGAIAVGWAALQHLIGGANLLGTPTRRIDAADLTHAGSSGHRLPATPQERGHLS